VSGDTEGDKGGMSMAWLAVGLTLLLVGGLTDIEILSPVLAVVGAAVLVVTGVQLLQSRRGRG